MPGTLYIVATPIGNLEDMTFRAVRILREADLIAAEDTRHSRKLLSHFGISRPLTSYFDHNAQLKGEAILHRLRGGENVALITDAGTPCISDPGYQLVRDAVAEGIVVVPVPGASAAVTALSASGLPTDAFLFAGFLPNRQGKRRERLAELGGRREVIIFYESPNRLAASLVDMRELLGERHVVIARELTKVYEEFLRGALTDVLATVQGREQVRGEVVILVAPPAEDTALQPVDSEELLRRYLRQDGLSLKDAVARASAESGRPRREVYAEALRLKEDV